ncbi:uncharacterized protein BO97DRAFT_422812 [Aspergillus homomorphus CBS 101889]|uniref:Uncharacterized protein n=1 Tax=Aspergillus homomorphus (strain CBS 101889) TaxID=1450537 RepID=A0A395I3T8_ASPHC|nr:hypothetical protein BO97DRAFT_422812 [Aspergillus homomorphus CBS 101889]RAL14396.1 hypothetical protein BO97DRAFT_422812 [Aspergillus homomorphus CBS 101889]
MGEQSDAEFILIDHIIEAWQLTSPEPVPCLHPADEPTGTEYFCRFAIRGGTDGRLACFTPLSSGLLSRKYRWSRPRYVQSRPSILDFSPRDLGLAEGFYQADCNVIAGFGFDSVLDMTWKARYPAATVYDDRSSVVFAGIESGQMSPPRGMTTDVLKVVLLSENRPLTIGTDQDSEHGPLFKTCIEEFSLSTKDIDFLLVTIFLLSENALEFKTFPMTTFSMEPTQPSTLKF